MLLFKLQHMVARIHLIENLLYIYKINALRKQLKYLKYLKYTYLD